MFNWMMQRVGVWSVRIGVLMLATWSMAGLVNRELGYRMEFVPMFIGGLITIVTVRIWMPWSLSTRTHDDR